MNKRKLNQTPLATTDEINKNPLISKILVHGTNVKYLPFLPIRKSIYISNIFNKKTIIIPLKRPCSSE